MINFMRDKKKEKFHQIMVNNWNSDTTIENAKSEMFAITFTLY